MNVRNRGLALVALIPLFILGGCQQAASEDPTVSATSTPATETGAGTAGPTSAASGKVAVRTMVLEARPFEETLEITGRLLPWKDVVISSEIGGLVREIGFEKGDWIEQGSLLARIGDDLMESQLAQARADLMAAEANFVKTSKLFERQAIPQQDLVKATSQRDRAAAVVRERELRLERAILRAPISGRATERLIEKGEVVAPGTQITTLQQVTRLKVQAAVPDTEVSWLKTGRDASVQVDAYPNRSFSAKLYYLAPAADTLTRSFTIELSLPNPEGALMPGMLGRVRLVRRRVDHAVVVPIDAMIARESGKSVFIVEDCRAREIALDSASYEGDMALAEGILSVGQALVVDGQRDLVDGQDVHSEECP